MEVDKLKVINLKGKNKSLDVNINILYDTDSKSFISLNKLINKLSFFELRLLLYYRKELYVSYSNELEDYVLVKSDNRDIGIYRTEKINTNKYLLKLEDSTNLLRDLFERVDESYKYDIENYNDLFDLYKNSLLKYYIKFLLMMGKYDYNEKIKSKYLKTLSYLVVREFFTERDGFYISKPNVYIKDINVEFDALLLRERDEIDKYIYDSSDVVGIINTTGSGCFGSKRLFCSDICFRNKNISDLDKAKLRDYPFIYFCLYESASNRGASIQYFKNTSDVLDIFNKKIGIFPLIRFNDSKFYIPCDYNENVIKSKIKDIINR